MVEINDDARGTYNINSQIKFKTTMLKSSLYDYSDVYILVKKKQKKTKQNNHKYSSQMPQQDMQIKEINKLLLKILHHLWLVLAKKIKFMAILQR